MFGGAYGFFVGIFSNAYLENRWISQKEPIEM